MICFVVALYWLIGTSSMAAITDNKKLTVLTVELGSIISGPLEQRAREFEQQTGVKVEIVKLPFGDLYDAINADFERGVSKYDIIVYASQWMVDFAQGGHIEDLTQRVLSDNAIQWFDVSRFFRDFSSKYNSKIYSIPVDGDVHLLYYRTDMLDRFDLNPPKTWDEYLAVAKRLHGEDMNGDGRPDYGSCISKKPNEQSYWSFLSIAGSYLQAKGTSQGMFFETRRFTPLVNNDAFAKVLDVYQQTSLYGPNELEMDTNDVRYAFIEGRCGLTVEWGDIGTMSVLPQSKVKNKTGVSMLPGSRSVLNRASGKLEKCTETSCPYAIDGINYAPYAAFGGWVGSISSHITEQNKKTAYQYLSYVSQPQQSNIDVTIGATGMNPYRTSQLVEHSNWVQSGMGERILHFYLGSITKTVNNANTILDLRIFQNNVYFRDVLDKELNNFLTNKLDIKQTMVRIESGWEKTTDKIGRKKQLEAYRSSLGLGGMEK